jgi:hypothetical protein
MLYRNNKKQRSLISQHNSHPHCSKQEEIGLDHVRVCPTHGGSGDCIDCSIELGPTRITYLCDEDDDNYHWNT